MLLLSRLLRGEAEKLYISDWLHQIYLGKEYKYFDTLPRKFEVRYLTNQEEVNARDLTSENVK